MATINNSNFITSLDVRNSIVLDGRQKGEAVQHFVYGSSLYGTTFGVFCQIKGKEQTDKKSFRIDSMLLKIINYSGVLNIGFWNGDLQPTHNEFDAENRIIRFVVQGANTKDEKRIFTPLLIVKEPVTITFKRIVYPLDGFIELNDNVKDRTKQSKSAIPVKPVFDTEFNYRNGKDLFFHLLRPGMRGFKETDENPLPSPRCHEGFVRLVYPCKDA